VIARLQREEAGFGLIELVFAMAILSVVVLALFAAFNAGAFSMRRAAAVSTAETLADKQMELYRAVLYDNIGLDSTLVAAADATHTGDAAWVSAASQWAAPSCTSSLTECKPVQNPVTGPDGRAYRIDTYVRKLSSGAGGPTNGRDVKQATVVVRNAAGKKLARLTTTFDKSTGCVSGSPC
jgi:prepilin-type N-terminal cleavage/methylation domain-containing protein